jgi:hypothetical protein
MGFGSKAVLKEMRIWAMGEFLTRLRRRLSDAGHEMRPRKVKRAHPACQLCGGRGWFSTRPRAPEQDDGQAVG